MKSLPVGERRTTEMLGGRRVLVSGRDLGDNPNADRPALGVEDEEEDPARIEDTMKQSEGAAEDASRPWRWCTRIARRTWMGW